MTPEEEAAKKAAQEAEVNQILFKDHKLFVDSCRFYIANEFTALRLNVGPQGYTFAFTPYLSKVLSQILTAQVKNWEDAFGEIRMAAPQPIPSPIQMDGLDGTDSEEKGSGGPGKHPPKK